MTEAPKTRGETLVGQWLTFLELRHQVAQLIAKMELTDSSLTFGIRDEKSFRDAFRDLQKLLDEMKALFGPEARVKPLVG